ncbi:MAG: oxidoreductase [Sulfitobacter sp.]|nr:oxidoreductase [Sulfitobacter sp.]
MSPIKVGLLGYGMAGRVFHAPLIMTEPRMELVRIGSRTFADKKLPEGVTAGAIDAVIDDPEIDLIVIATPNDSHAPLARRALAAGKHVVVDKPFALSAEEAVSVIEAAREADRLLSVFQNRRWDGGFLTAQMALSKNRLGEVSYAALHFDRYSPVIKNRWREQAVPGSGVLYDLGPHLLDQILCLFGKPDAITATLAAQREGAIVDDFFHITCGFGARQVVAHASALMPDHGPRIALYGDRATLFQYGFDGQEGALKEGRAPDDPGWGETPGSTVIQVGPDGTETELEPRKGAYEAYYANVAAAILDGAPLEVTPDQALTVMQMLDAARLSAETGRRVTL